MTIKDSLSFLGLIAAMLVVSAFVVYVAKPPQVMTDHKAGPFNSGEIPEEASIQKASFSFAVTDIQRDGNVVSFVIPEDARALEKKADAVVLSGLYASGQQKSDQCPVVESTAVAKSVQSYNPMSGKARVQAHFDDEAMAKAAQQAGCLLINDPS